MISALACDVVAGAGAVVSSVASCAEGIGDSDDAAVDCYWAATLMMMMTSNHIPYTGAAIIHSVDNEYDDGLPMNMKYDLTGVCNGLICLRAETLKDGFYLTWVRFWNPDTRLISKKSPCIQFQIQTPRRGCKMMGFGSRDTCKVVTVVVDWE
ncbi:hypothetical protein JHK87_013295 [Glycine soja]|nr:hypothetical protein JHK87_013295 [Glycine soja]